MSELRFITAEAVQTDRAEITNKGKRRTVFLPDKLRRLLKKYLQGQKKTAGAVFTTRTGKPLDRSNIWRDMKALCESAGVEPGKVFPHNLRHLFARTYYIHRKRPLPAGGHSGSLLCQHHQHLHRGERQRPSAPDGAHGAGYHIVSVLWWRA